MLHPLCLNQGLIHLRLVLGLDLCLLLRLLDLDLLDLAADHLVVLLLC